MSEEVTLVWSDNDYVPVVLHSSHKGVMFRWSNMYEPWYVDFAEGYVAALGLELNNIYIDNMYSVIEYKDFLEKIGLYDIYIEHFGLGNSVKELA